ncbi:Tetraspanin family-domain-containing protein [Endogone sp. FLAS-F59071]|nr:Tetraspanin family-domain-containing protein [Endogone sp. FLAS-F59071]|eukprot:RUS17791.1 Tetraspanin family-domain-containing protein [Endogone sp. FLAS-F59071]
MSYFLFCQGISKPLLILVNSLLAIMAVGYLILALLSYVGVLAGSHIIPSMLVNLVVGLGIFVLLSSILGFFAALRPQYPNLMYSYAVIILLALMFQAATAVVIFTTTKQVAQWSVVEWNAYDPMTRSAVQSEFDCCGFSGPYEAPAITNHCNPLASNFNASSVVGCYPRIANFVSTNFSVAYGILFFCLTLEALGLTNALTLICMDPNLVKFSPHGSDLRDSRRQTHQTVGMLQPDDFDDNSHITSRSSPNGGGSAFESKSDYPYPGVIREPDDPRQSSRTTFVPYGVPKTDAEIIAWGRGGARSPYRGDSNRLRSAFEDHSMVASVYSGGVSEPPIPMAHHNSLRGTERVRTLSPLAELERARAASIYSGSDRGAPAQQSPRQWPGSEGHDQSALTGKLLLGIFDDTDAGLKVQDATEHCSGIGLHQIYTLT